MSERVYGNHYQLFLEDVFPLCPPSQLGVVVGHSQPHVRSQPVSVFVHDEVVAGELADQFFHEEGGVAVELGLEGGRQQDAVDQLEVELHYGVVEVGLGPQLLQVVLLHGEGVLLVLALRPDHKRACVLLQGVLLGVVAALDASLAFC